MVDGAVVNRGRILSEDDRIPDTALMQPSAVVNGCERRHLAVSQAAHDGTESTLTCEADGKDLDSGAIFGDGDDWVLARRPGMASGMSTCPL